MVVLEGIVLSVNKWVMSCGRPQQRDHSSDKRKEKRQKTKVDNKKKREEKKTKVPRFLDRSCIFPLNSHFALTLKYSIPNSP